MTTFRSPSETTPGSVATRPPTGYDFTGPTEAETDAIDPIEIVRARPSRSPTVTVFLDRGVPGGD